MSGLVTDENLASIEEFVLSPDRRGVLERRFVPGSKAHAILKGLVEVWDGNMEAAKAALQSWEHFPASMQSWEHFPASKSFECLLKIKGWEAGDVGRKELQKYLIEYFGLDFDVHEDHVVPSTPAATSQANGASSQPVRAGIDEKLLDSSDILNRLEGSLDDCEPMAIFLLLRRKETSAETRREILLSASSWSALPDVVPFIATMVSTPDTKREVLSHINTLTTDQLMELGKISPEIAGSLEWVVAVVKSLYPKVYCTKGEVEEFLNAVETFADSLPPKHAWLKQRVLFARVTAMVESRSIGSADLVEFLECDQLIEGTGNNVKVDLGPRIPQLDLSIVPQAIGIIAECSNEGASLFDAKNGLSRQLQKKSNSKIFAEGMLLKGQANSQAYWTDIYIRAGGDLPALQARVDLEFLSTNKKEWAVEEQVVLELAIKNVPNMIVKIFEMDAWSFACATGKEVDIDVDLEGLGPAVQESFKVDSNPMDKTIFKYECLEGRRGVFVVEFVGGGKISKAIIKKGGIHWLDWPFHGGHAFKVMDENNSPLKDAKIWMDGQTFEVDPESGEIIVPFVPRIGTRNVVIGASDDMATCATIDFVKEKYELSGSISLDPEANVPHEWASLLIEATLRLEGQPVPMELLEDVRLEASTTDADGVENWQHVKGFKIHDGKMTVQQIRLPDRCTSLCARLRGRVRTKTQASYDGESSYQDVEFENSHKFNSTLTSSDIRDMFLARDAVGNFVVRVLGKCGEDVGNVGLRMLLKHVLKKRSISCDGRTDDQGCFNLGKLEGVTKVEASFSNGYKRRVWNLSQMCGWCNFDNEIPVNVDWKAGGDVFVPCQKHDVFIDSTEKGFRLYSVNELDELRENLTAKLSYVPGYVCARGLTPGRYLLETLATGRTTVINVLRVDKTVAAGSATALVNRDVGCQQSVRKPMQITRLECSASEGLLLELGGEPEVLRNTRIMIAFNRFVPTEAKDASTPPPSPPPWATRRPLERNISQLYEWQPSETEYGSTKLLSDESRYVVERRENMSNSCIVGNMLPKPSLLINPFRTRETETSVVHAEHSDCANDLPLGCFGGMGHCSQMLESGFQRKQKVKRSRIETMPVMEEASHLFCPSSVTFVVGGGTGFVRLSCDDLLEYGIDDLNTSGHTFARVMAVGPSGSRALDSTFVARDHSAFGCEKRRDLGLNRALDEQAFYVEGRAVTSLTSGDSMTITDASFGKFRVLSSVADMWKVFLTIISPPFGNPWHLNSGKTVKDTLLEFSFILRWPGLSTQQKLSHLTSNSCHELHFFIKHRDPEFFKQYSLPILKNKNKTEMDFMDEYLIDEENLVTKWMAPAKFNMLGLAEKCLLVAKLSPQRAAQYGKDLRDICRAQSTRKADDAKWRHIFSIALASGGEDGNHDVIKECQEQEEREKDSIDEDDMDFEMDACFLQTLCSRPSCAAPKHGNVVNLAQRSPGMASMIKSSLASRGITTNGPAQYHQVQKAQEWMEMGYWKSEHRQEWTTINSCGDFWADFVSYHSLAERQEFLSKYLLGACQTFTEAMLALSLCGLPIQASPDSVKIKSEGPSVTIATETPCLVCHKEMKPTQPGSKTGSVSLIQHIFDPVDPIEIDPETGDKIERVVASPLKAGKRYSYRAVLTNFSGSQQNLDVLTHVPEGSFPLGGKPATVSLLLQLGSYECTKLEWEFYFPLEGVFNQYPMTVSMGDKLLAATVVDGKLTVERDPVDVRPIDSLCWEEFSKRASNDEVLNYLKSGNLAKANLLDLSIRLKNPDFYFQAIDILRQRCCYNDAIWCWSVFHLDGTGLKEFLPSQQRLVNLVGPIETELMKVSALDYGYKHLEYWPLINARTHKLKGTWSMANESLKEQWKQFLEMAIRLPKLDLCQGIEAAHYLLAQDRFDDATKLLQQMDLELQNPENQLVMAMQVDLMKAWLDLSNPQSDLSAAHDVSKKYRMIGHGKWSKWFGMLQDTLEEIEQGAGQWEMVDEEEHKALAPTLQIDTDHGENGDTVVVDYRNVASIDVKIYPMDVELLFSSSPFTLISGSTQDKGEADDLGQFAAIKPFQTRTLELEGTEGEIKLSLHDLFPDSQSQSLMVCVGTDTLQRTTVRHGNDLRVRAMEKMGVLMVRIAADNLPVAGAYVKVFAREKSGDVVFHKDGYSDRRGKFDYATLSSHGVEDIDKFAIMVATTQHGCVTLAAKPPAH